MYSIFLIQNLNIHIVLYHLFSFHVSIQDYKILMDMKMKVVIFA